MMINRLHRQLISPCSIRASSIDQANFSKTSSAVFSQFVLSKNEFDPDLSCWLNSIGLKINFGEIFRTSPFSDTKIHVDGAVMDETCKLNWVFDANGSVMSWWKPIDPLMQIVPKVSSGGTKYLGFDKHECDMIYSAEIGQPSLVNVGVPHNVSNPTDQARWCISYTLGKIGKAGNLQWDDAISHLGPCFQ